MTGLLVPDTWASGNTGEARVCLVGLASLVGLGPGFVKIRVESQN